jgi:MraZ protein
VYYGGRALGREIPRFVGSVEHALDEKGRLVVPIRFRERLGVEFILTIAQPDPCLALYPAATWDRVCERLEAAPVKGQGYRRFIRHLFAHTEEVTCDPQGRFLVPPAMRAYAGIERTCVLIGSLTRVEIWAKERLGSLQPSAEEAEAFSTELGLF